MRRAYFNAEGGLIILMENPTNVITPPEGSVYYADIEDDSISANELFYDIDNSTISKKQRMDLVINNNKVSNIPIGSEVIFYGGKYEVLDGEIELDSNLEEYILLYIQHPKYETSAIDVWAGT